MMQNGNLYYFLLYFFVYGFLGWICEVSFAAVKHRRFVNRGFLNGPICPIYGFGVVTVIGLISPYKENLILLYLASIVLVTLLEGVTGWAMDKIFHNKWWDYSEMPLNIGGYVCLLFSLIWGAACVLIVDMLHPLIHGALALLPHFLGTGLLIVAGAVIFADLYVTVSQITKLNHHLENMEKIAAELREISNEIGEDVYKKTMSAIELKEELAEKRQDMRTEIQEISEEMGQRINDLRTRYKELESRSEAVGRRLIQAFPKMKSRRFGRHLMYLKEQLERDFKK